MALTRDKRNLLFRVGSLLALMALLQFFMYDIVYQPHSRIAEKEPTLIRKSYEGMSVDKLSKPERCNNRLCTYFYVSFNGSETLSRIVFLLHNDKKPKTVENFRALCTGEKGVSPSRTRLHYQGTLLNRVVHNILVQGGDINFGKASEGQQESVYGASFELESHDDQFHERGILGMAGLEKTGSEFFITLDVVSELDGMYVAFGEVVEGMDVVARVNSFELINDGEPAVPIVIQKSGQF